MDQKRKGENMDIYVVMRMGDGGECLPIVGVFGTRAMAQSQADSLNVPGFEFVVLGPFTLNVVLGRPAAVYAEGG